VVLVSLKDRAKFEKSMRALVERYPDVLEMHGETRGARIRHRKTSFLERDIHLLEITEHDGDPVPVVPCWTVADDHAAFALYPHALKHLLTNRPSFDGNRAFAAALKHVPEGAVSHTYFDLPRVVGYLYNTAVPVLQGLQGAIDRELAPYGASVNLHDLPRAEAITKHLSPCVSYTRVEKNALRFGYVSPCGHWLVTGTGAAAGLAVALVAQGEAMAMDRTEAEKARMRAEITALRNRLRAERARWAKRLAELEAKVEELARILEEDG